MKRDHLEFLCDVGELSALLTGSSDVRSLLDRIVRLAAQHLQAHVCSIYVYEELSDELVLRATVGLQSHSANEVRLHCGEGLVGQVLESGSPILDNHASNNPHYKFIPGIGEERYDSFLAVPLLKGADKIGVLTVQREEKNYFEDDDLSALRVVARQLVGCIENAQALMVLPQLKPVSSVPLPPKSFLVRGQVTSMGSGAGPARVLRTTQSLSKRLSELDTKITIDQFRAAVNKTIAQIEALQLRVAKRLPEAVSLIFSAHLLMLKDKAFINKITQLIEGGSPVGLAIFHVAQSYIDLFSASKPVHIREKAQDVEDLAVRLANNLTGTHSVASSIERQEVVIANNVFPSDLVLLSLEELAGIVLVGGGATSHVSILARSLRLPLFIADAPELMAVIDGTPMMLDGHTGNIYVSPREDIVEQFEQQKKMMAAAQQGLQRPRGITRTSDGTRIRLQANINLLSELPVAREVNAEGIGLYRTEFPFMIRNSFPDEEEQHLVYRQLVRGMDGKSITFRTLDVGGDKTLSYYEHREENPELGLRAIRFSLHHQELFEQQVRAILRAGAEISHLRIMFPMISSLDEFRQSRAIVENCKRQLQADRIPYHHDPEIGMMVELPAVLETADEFSREADFFSIGSNDFIQYMLAADRGNKQVAHYYCAHHPAVLRAIARFVRVAHQHNRAVSVCGEMAQQTHYIPFLLGVGIRDLSVSPHRVGELHKFIQSTDIVVAERQAKRLLSEATIAGVEQWLELTADFSSTDALPIDAPAS
ncbi:MAG: phosphoenolpyruvate--protein phosphotransferase [Pirellulaceae bacterium]|nr:phosphoenolpyruvate--protein phosphotransferase [Pirellulaceae bacterium]